MKVGVKLPLLGGHSARRDHAELASAEIYSGSRQNFSVAVDDHPLIERGVQTTDILTKLLVGVAVDDRARLLAALFPQLQIFDRSLVIFDWFRTCRDVAPGPRRVQCARKSSQEI